MTAATISIQYVNLPKEGKKKGAVKSTDGTTYWVWADKIGQFYVGATYDVEYKSEDWEGKTYHTITSVTPRHTGAPPAGPAQAAPVHSERVPYVPNHQPVQGGGKGIYKETSAKDAERMFVCSLLNAFIQAGKVDLRTDSVASAANAMRSAWQQTFGAQQ